MILFLTNTFPTDNRLKEGKFNYRAAIQLSEKTHLKIIHLRSWKPWRKIVERKKIGKLEVIVFSFPLYPIRSLNTLQGLQILLYKQMFKMYLGKELKNIKLVHSVGANFSGVVGSFLSKKYEIPHLAQCIGTDINYNLPRIKNTLGIRGMEKNVTVFTTNSKESENQVLRIYPNVKTATIYRGVDLTYFKNPSAILISKQITFTFLGGLSLRKETGMGRDYKGGETLLKAWKSLTNYDDLKLNFVGPEVTDALMISLLGGEPNSYNISVNGIIDSLAVKEMLLKTDVVIIPSWAEGLPNAGMEALAASCAIIGSKVGGIPELIDGNGYLFEPGDSKSLGMLLNKIAINKMHLEKMKVKSRQIAETKFDAKQFGEQYFKLYETL